MEFWVDVERVRRIGAVPAILEVMCRTTGMGLAVLARVTVDRWVACSVLDKIGYGLVPGDELKIETTICRQVQQSRRPVIINTIDDDEFWCNNLGPSMYGFQSYISLPIILADGSFFGTLCALDRRPVRLNKPDTIGMFGLFAELIANHLDADPKVAAAESAMTEERAVSELREQPIAVLVHHLRTSVSAVNRLSELLLQTPLNDRAARIARVMSENASRMTALIDNLLDIAHGRSRDGEILSRDATESLVPILRGRILEANAYFPNRVVEIDRKPASEGVWSSFISPQHVWDTPPAPPHNNQDFDASICVYPAVTYRYDRPSFINKYLPSMGRARNLAAVLGVVCALFLGMRIFTKDSAPTHAPPAAIVTEDNQTPHERRLANLRREQADNRLAIADEQRMINKTVRTKGMQSLPDYEAARVARLLTDKETLEMAIQAIEKEEQSR